MMFELDKAALDRWITREDKTWEEEWCEEDDYFEPDPDEAYDKAREDRLFGV